MLIRSLILGVMPPRAQHLCTFEAGAGPSRQCLTRLALQRVWEGVYLGRPVVLKQRFSKHYRHPALDARLTQARLRQVRAQCSMLH